MEIQTAPFSILLALSSILSESPYTTFFDIEFWRSFRALKIKEENATL